MYDFAVVNTKPGPCEKCGGTGVYNWGGTINGKPRKSGTCYSCRGSGYQDQAQRQRNACYNRNKVIPL